MKKQIVIIGLIVILLGLLSGCFDDNYAEGKLYTTKGFLIDIIDNSRYTTFIFQDDIYLDIKNLGNYNLTQLNDFKNKDVEIKYAGNIFAKLVNIKEV